MGCDIMVALGPATQDGNTVFGVHHFGLTPRPLALRSITRQVHAADAIVPLAAVELAQVRQTHGVLGMQPHDTWGLNHGVNEAQVAVGMTRWQSRLPRGRDGLAAPELVRLTLERCRSALHGVEVLIDLIARFGLANVAARTDDGGGDAIFVVADAQEAYVIEAAGTFWALLACQHMHAVSDAALIRQDWLRLAPGLGEHALRNGWWPDNGTKVDFVGSTGEPQTASAWSSRRWGKATLMLARHSGALDGARMRRILQEHFQLTVRQSPAAPRKPWRMTAAHVVSMTGAGPALVWHGVGPQDAQIYFPLVVGVELPEVWENAALTWPTTLEPSVLAKIVERCQIQFQRDADEFVAEATQLRSQGDHDAAYRLAQVLMQKHVEEWDVECRCVRSERFQAEIRVKAAPAEEDAVTYAFG